MLRACSLIAWALFAALACDDKVDGRAAPPARPSGLSTNPSAPKAERPPLEYVELVTGGAQTAQALPLIVAIHGLGDAPKNFAALFDGFAVPARIVVPQAPTPYHDGFSWFPLSHGLSTDESVEGIRRSSALLAELIAWMKDHKKTIGRPIVTGFSQGGALSFALSIAHPELVGAAVPVGGWLPPPLWPDEGSPKRYPEVHALHGADDTRVPVSGAQAVVSRMREVGRSAHIETFRGVGHSISEEMRKRLFALLEHQLQSESR